MGGGICAACLILVLASVASAQPGDCEAPDVVLTVQGGMMRGLIAESIPGERVVIRLATGETRTIPASEIQFAGPRAQAPTGTPSTLSRPPPPGADVSFTSTTAGLIVHRLAARTGAGHTFERLCIAPCTARLPLGHVALAVSRGLESPILIDSITPIDGPVALDVRYVDRTGEQVAGSLVLGLGISVGSVMIPGGVALAGNFGTASTAGGVLLATAGVLVTSASLVVGLFLSCLRSVFTIDRAGALTW